MDICIDFNNNGRKISIIRGRSGLPLMLAVPFLHMLRLSKIIAAEEDERLVRIRASEDIAGLDYDYVITPADTVHCKVRIYRNAGKRAFYSSISENHIVANAVYVSDEPLDLYEDIIATELQMDGCPEIMDFHCVASRERDIQGTPIYLIEFYISLDSVEERYGKQNNDCLVLAYSFLHRALEVFFKV